MQSYVAAPSNLGWTGINGDRRNETHEWALLFTHAVKWNMLETRLGERALLLGPWRCNSHVVPHFDGIELKFIE